MSIFSPNCASCIRHSKNGKWDWESCLGKEWWIKDEWFYIELLEEFYEPQDIKYCPRQIKWLLSNQRELKRGRWPANPTGEEDCDVHVFNYHAPYETPGMVIGEVEARLSKCGLSGRLIECVYYEGMTIEQVANKYLYKLSDLEFYLRKMIKYISGFKRKHETYSQWIHRGRGRKRQ